MVNYAWIDRENLETIKNTIPEHIYPWLSKSNHLTATLQATGVTFSLSILSQSVSQPYPDEIQALDAEYQSALIRKVFLKGNEEPMIFARVVVPEPTYRHYQKDFDHLGDAPIGQTLLYNRDDVFRGPFEYQLLLPNSPLFQEVKAWLSHSIQPALWARRSVFRLRQGALLISEVFLGSLPAFPLKPS